MEMEIDPKSDAALVADTLSGASEAFGKLYDRYARIVRAVVLGVSGDWRGVEDMVQECFLRAYRKLATLQEPQRFGAWMTGVARQVGRERRRAMRRDRHEYGDSDILAGASAIDASADLQQRDELNRVMQSLSELEERERLAVHAYFLEGRGAEDTADLLGLSRSGLYALVRRAVAKLAVAMQTCGSKDR